MKWWGKAVAFDRLILGQFGFILDELCRFLFSLILRENWRFVFTRVGSLGRGISRPFWDPLMDLEGWVGGSAPRDRLLQPHMKVFFRQFQGVTGKAWERVEGPGTLE